MRKLIRKTHQEWMSAKDDAMMQKENAGDFGYARSLYHCNMFRGDETLEELANLMFSARGIEFITQFGFPSLQTLRKFKKYNPQAYGIYIDAGNIALNDTERVFLVGNTTANVNYQATQRNRLYAIYGAKARVLAKGFSVTKIEKDATSKIDVIKIENAVVL